MARSLRIWWMIVFVTSAVSALDQTVNTTSGWVQGKRATIETNEVLMFTGIPYAEPPTGNLRFKPPQVKSRMTDIINATDVPPFCPQPIYLLTELDRVFAKPFMVNGSFNAVVSEDCLYLNVFVPSSANAANPLPVMAYIHGGGFTTGAGIVIGGEVLAALNNIIVVTFNYRLGVLGLLDTEDDSSVGNFAMRDQVVALKWIQANIAEFGGDAGNVTLAGESAGAACVSQLLVSPLGEGLFKRAIIQSGNPFSFWTHVNSPLKMAKALGAQIGCQTSTTNALVDCLRLKSVDEIITHQSNPALSWAPTYRTELFPENPTDSTQEGKTPDWFQKLAKIDILIGNTKQEGALFYLYSVAQLNNTENGIKEEFFVGVIRRYALLVGIPEKHLDSILPMVKYVYTNWEDSSSGISRSIKLIDFIGDMLEYTGGVAFARVHAKSDDVTRGRSYFYRLNPRPSWMTIEPWTNGADHADDLFFVFGHPFSRNDLNATEQDKLLSRRVMTYWSNFVKTGNPNQPNPIPVEWPEYTKNGEQFLELDINMTEKNINSHIFADRMAFWTNFIPAELERLDAMVTPTPCIKQSTLSTSSAEMMFPMTALTASLVFLTASFVL